MSGDTCESKLILVQIQENGIIRMYDGEYLGRLDDKVSYEVLSKRITTLGELLSAHRAIDVAFYGLDQVQKMDESNKLRMERLYEAVRPNEDEDIYEAVIRRLTPGA